MERTLAYIEQEIVKEGIFMLTADGFVDTPLPKDMIDMEVSYEKIEEELRQVNANAEEMNRTYVQLVELKHVLRAADEFFETRQNSEDEVDSTDASPLTTENSPGSLSQTSSLEIELPARIPRKEQETVGFVAGMIPVDRYHSFARMMWRVGRGIIFVRQIFIDEPITDVHGEKQQKCVFLTFFPGEELKQRVHKICEAFRANVYSCPEDAEGRREVAIEVFNGSQDHRMKVLANAARKLHTWKIQVAKMKAVFYVMNMLNFDVTQKCLIAECWIPDRDMGKVQGALRRGTEAAGSTFPCIINRVETERTPPTLNRTTAFTSGFQSLVDAYGVGNYLEMNPAPYTIITFPFLFAVMFGDAGHGLLLTLFALALIFYEKPLSRVREEITSMIFGGRYLVLLMGLFSIYTGLIYNDTFSKSIAIFRSNWVLHKNSTSTKDMIMIDPRLDYRNRSYPFGIDPIWMLASNKIQFTNSYKMKMAVVVGVLHMTFGTVLSLWNHTFFKDRTGFPPPRSVLERMLRRNLDIWAVFVPELTFLLSLFGYLVFMVFYKWMLPFGAGHGEGPSCSRSILIMFINMVMQFGSVGDTETSLCYQKPMYHGQSGVQMIILLLALVAVPWLLFAKPLYLFYLHRLHSTPLPQDFVPVVLYEEPLIRDDAEGKNDGSSSSSRRKKSAVSLRTLRSDDHEQLAVIQQLDHIESYAESTHQFELGEVFIHQIIHTIEYCLGAVSNTASYLRLWALSLAHAQLSEVLWSMVFKSALFSAADRSLASSVTASLMIYASWAGWAVLTVCILLLMEGLSAFLHALRLHWVEFMNKFFKGEGYAFVPFSFAQVLRDMSVDTI
ncbi:v-type proton ATPase 116 kDa subunit a isoform 1-like [Tropilaelaps mercedesae]|uniref:V-type proton ATPase subunit a n=1 Tax=Tropilaelaps mercedesae TaxID=418985 RepID=A0A1V9XA58_9ACAR|nr:v-type proton ATPase 116 kDa subunit a isoform 1-like [Tropilaelaps mercedesae]